MVFDATTARVFAMPPYFFFYTVGVVFASAVFILLLLKYDFSIPQYTKIFFISAVGLLVGARLFGIFTGLYRALANQETITADTFLNTGIVFYGGLIGFILSFMLICRVWNKKIDCGVLDLLAVCIPLFHFWGRLGCFFSGCCYGIESYSIFAVLYTSHAGGEVTTVSRIPVQIIEAVLNAMIFILLIRFLFKQMFKGRLLISYLFVYASMRIILELFRGDLARGVWNGVSFSQVVSVFVLISCLLVVVRKSKETKYGIR